MNPDKPPRTLSEPNSHRFGGKVRKGRGWRKKKQKQKQNTKRTRLKQLGEVRGQGQQQERSCRCRCVLRVVGVWWGSWGSGPQVLCASNMGRPWRRHMKRPAPNEQQRHGRVPPPLPLSPVQLFVHLVPVRCFAALLPLRTDPDTRPFQTSSHSLLGFFFPKVKSSCVHPGCVSSPPRRSRGRRRRVLSPGGRLCRQTAAPLW